MNLIHFLESKQDFFLKMILTQHTCITVTDLAKSASTWKKQEDERLHRGKPSEKDTGIQETIPWH
jgi:hypothetical protein